MRRALSNRPSPAMVVALLALFVALGGTGYAAVKINGKNIRNHTISGKKLKRNTLTGTQIRESRLGTVPRAAYALTLAGRGPSAFLSAGGAAADSRKLGGVAASGYVKRDCSSNTGQIKGFAAVDSSASFSSSFVQVSGYNCSGRSVEARRLSMGRYEVRFNGSPVTRAVATSIVTGVSADAVSILSEGPGLFQVNVLNPVPSPGAFVDHAFTMIAP
jgi:hypothetical protein